MNSPSRQDIGRVSDGTRPIAWDAERIARWIDAAGATAWEWNLSYKGYTGTAGPTGDGAIRGKVNGVRDTITFRGANPAEAEAEFRKSVDDYLDFCRELGEEPDRPGDRP